MSTEKSDGEKYDSAGKASAFIAMLISLGVLLILGGTGVLDGPTALGAVILLWLVLFVGGGLLFLNKSGEKDDATAMDELIAEAVVVVNAFDQANTGRVIANIGSRGETLQGAVNDLRSTLNRDEKRTILTEQQVID